MSKLTKKTIYLAAFTACFAMTAATYADGLRARNLLDNDGFEASIGDEWVTMDGSFARTTGGTSGLPDPYSGSYFYKPNTGVWSSIKQVVDLTDEGLDQHRIETGGYRIRVAGYQASRVETASEYDAGKIILRQLAPNNTELSSGDLGWVASGPWVHSTGDYRLVEGATKLRYEFWADQRDAWNGTNDACLDNAVIRLYGYDIWTWGGSSVTHADTGDWDIDGELNLDGGITVAGNATLITRGDANIDGTFNLKWGKWDARDPVTIGFDSHEEGTLNVTNGGLLESERLDVGYSQTSVGTINITSGTIDSDGTYVGVNGTGTVNVYSNGTFNTAGFTTIGRHSHGDGTVNVDGGTWNVTPIYYPLEDLIIGDNGTGKVNVTNNGTWEIDRMSTTVGLHGGTGIITVSDGGTWNSEDVTLGNQSGSSGTVNLDGGDWNTNHATVVGKNGAGTVNIYNGGTWTTTATTYVGRHGGGKGQVNIDGGTWDISADVYVGTESGSQGTVTIANGGNWDFDRNLTLGHAAGSQGTVNVQNGGTLIPGGTFKVGAAGKGTVNVSGGQLTVPNQILSINSQSSLNISGGTVRLDQGLTNSGTIQLTGGKLSIDGPVDSLFDYYTGGTLELRGTGTSYTDDEMIALTNATLKLDGATYNVASGGHLSIFSQLEFGNLGGTVNLMDGQFNHSVETLQLADGCQITGTGEIFVGSAGLNLGTANDFGSLIGDSTTEPLTVFGNISGSGSLENVVTYGNISVGNSPGRIFADDLSLSSSASLKMELGGLLSGTEYDQIVATGLFNVDGLLDIVWYDGFEAVLGDTFALFDLTNGGTINGTFASMNLPSFTDPELSWDTANLYTIGEINVVPEPTTISLLALTALALVRRRNST